MKYYRLKETDYVIGWEKLDGDTFHVIPKIVKKDLFKGYYKDNIERFENYFVKSKEELINLLNEFDECIQSGLVSEIIDKVGIEEYEINYKDIPCIVIQCESLNDQFECDANRVPTLYLKSAKELETLDLDYFYEVYLISEDGKLTLCKEYSSYK
jgi:hypothetical protein